MPRLNNMPDTVAFFTSHCCTDKTFKMWRAFYTVVSPIRPSWHYNIQHMERRLTCLRHVWLLNGLEWNWLASPLKASRWTVTVCQNQPIDTHDWFSFGRSRPDYVNEICRASSHPTHTPICMMIFSILTYNNYCVSSRAVIAWQHDKGCKDKLSAHSR